MDQIKSLDSITEQFGDVLATLLNFLNENAVPKTTQTQSTDTSSSYLPTATANDTNFRVPSVSTEENAILHNVVTQLKNNQRVLVDEIEECGRKMTQTKIDAEAVQKKLDTLLMGYCESMGDSDSFVEQIKALQTKIQQLLGSIMSVSRSVSSSLEIPLSSVLFDHSQSILPNDHLSVNSTFHDPSINGDNITPNNRTVQMAGYIKTESNDGNGVIEDEDCGCKKCRMKYQLVFEPDEQVDTVLYM